MKKIRFWAFIVMIVMLCCSCGNADTADGENSVSDSMEESIEIKPVMYKVNGDKGNTVYLFGTSEITGKELYPLPDYVMEAYEKSKVIAAEIDMTDSEISEKYAKLSYYSDGSKLYNHVSGETYGRVRSLIESFSGSYSFTYDELNAAEMARQLSTIILSEAKNYGTVPEITAFFAFRGKADGKKTVSLETVSTLSERVMSDEYSEYILNRTIDRYSDKSAYIDEKNSEFLAYAGGDNDAYLWYLSGAGTYSDDIAAEYSAKAIDARINYFTDRINELIKSGDDVFVTVGAELLTVPAGGGIVSKLEKLGYYVYRADYDMFTF